MRIALLTVAALAAGTAVGIAVPVSIAAADTETPSRLSQPSNTTSYRDPAQADAATVAVTGTLTPVHTETNGHQYVVSLPGGTLVPVSLGDADDHADHDHATHDEHEVERPAAFRGTLALPDSIVDRAEARGADIAPGEDLTSTSDDGRDVLAAARVSGTALPVQRATYTTEPAAATSASAHRLYLAVITNRGAQESSSSIASKTASMRSYWTTNTDGLISAFSQPNATVSYSSAQASAANHCGLGGNTSSVWNEAAAKFPGVDFSTAGNHLMIVAPESCADGAVGIGTVGGSLRSGGRSIVTLGDTGVAVGVHELGHNFSLQHANAERCSSACSKEEYWDLYSIMGLAVSGGSWTPASLDTTYRLQTGIATSSEVRTVTQSATVQIGSRGASSGTRGLLVTDPVSKIRYVVDYRAGTGRDASAFYAPGRNIGNYTYRRGVVVTRIDSDYDSTTVMTRASGSRYVTSYVAGESFARGKVTIAVQTLSDNTATVAVTLPGSTATPTPTTSSSSPSPSPSPVAPTGVPTDLPTDDPTDSPTDDPTSTPPPAPKSFTAANPVIVGTPQVGRRLAVRPGEWSPRPERLTAQWFAGGRAISRATGGAIVVPRSAYNLPITVRFTGARSGYQTATRTSAPTSRVTAGRFTSKRVRITGSAKVGRTLVARTGSWSPQPQFSYRWYANGKTIKKAKGRTMKVTRALRGKRISVRITARQAGYHATTQASRRTGNVR